MPLQNFVDQQGPVISSAFLNVVDAQKTTVLNDAVTKATARTALTSDLPLEITNGGTGVRTLVDLGLLVGAALYGQTTPDELAAGVVIVNTNYPPLNVLRYGTNTTPGTTNMTTAIQAAINVAIEAGAGRVFLPKGLYAITATLTVSVPIIFEGEGCTTGVTEGSIIQNTTNDVPVFLLDGATNNDVQRCAFRDFGIIHNAASKYAIEVRRGAYAMHRNVVIDCNSVGKGGFLAGSDTFHATADLSSNNINAWQCTYDNCVVHDAVDACFKGNTNGHTTVYRDCSPRTSVANGRGYLITMNNAHIKGGQAAATGAGGIPIHFLNLRDGSLRGGSVEDVRFEGVDPGEYAIVVDGTTDIFFDIEIRRCTMHLDNELGTLVLFGRAHNCKLVAPDIASPVGGGFLFQLGQFSEDCVVECDFEAAKAPQTIHASATRGTKVVRNRIPLASVTSVSTATNLTTILEDGVEGLSGIFPVHNGVSWNYAPVSPAQLVANTDNYAPTGLGHNLTIRVSTDASRNLTGLVAQVEGTRVALCNVGAQNLVLMHDVTSTNANRFLCPGSVDYTLNANDSVNILYDGTSSRWRVLAAV